MPNNIRKFLEAARQDGIKIADIIDKSGVGRTSFYDILNGKQIPRIDTAFKIANALNKDIVDVFPNLNDSN